MVWPSICLESSHSRSISSAWALPSTKKISISLKTDDDIDNVQFSFCLSYEITEKGFQYTCLPVWIFNFELRYAKLLMGRRNGAIKISTMCIKLYCIYVYIVSNSFLQWKFRITYQISTSWYSSNHNPLCMVYTVHSSRVCRTGQGEQWPKNIEFSLNQ